MSLCFNGNQAYKRLQRSTGTNHPLFIAETTYEACLHEGTKKTTNKKNEKVKLEGCVVPAIVPYPGGDCAACADINLDARYKSLGDYKWEVTFDDNYNDGERITYPLGNLADPTPSGLIPVCYRCNPTKDRKSKDGYHAKAMKKQEKNRARPPSIGIAVHICGMILEDGSSCTTSVRADGIMCLTCMKALRKLVVVCPKKNLCTFFDRRPMEEKDDGEQESTFTYYIFKNRQAPYPIHLLIKDDVPIERANKLEKTMSDRQSMRSGLNAKFRAAVNEDMASAMMAACLASASAQSNRRASDILFQFIPSLLNGITDFSKVKGDPFSFLFHWSLLHVDDWVASNGEIVLMPSYDFSDDLSELVDHGGHVSSKTYTTANPLTAGWYQGHWRVNRRAVRNNGGPEGFKLCLCIFGQTNPGYWGTNQVVNGRNGVIFQGCELLCSKTGILRPDAVAEVTFGRNDGLVLSCSDIISTKIVRIGGNMSTPVDIPIDDDSVVVNKYGIFPRSTFDADAMNAQVKKAAESSSTATSAKKTSAPSKKSAKKGVGKGSSNSIMSHFSSSAKKQSKPPSKSHKQRPMAAAKSMLSNNKKRSNDDSDDSDIEIVSSNKASSFRAAKKSKSSLPVKTTTHHSFSSEESEEESCGYKSEGEEDDDNEVMAGWQGSSRRGKGISVKIDDSFLNQEQIKTLEDKVATAPSLLLAGKLSDADIIICANKAAADNMARYSELPIVKEKWLEHPDHEHITQYAFKRDAGDDEVIDLFDSD